MSNLKEVLLGQPTVNDKQLPFSQVIRAGDFLYCSGQIPIRDGKTWSNASVEEQTENIIQGLSLNLEQCGCSLKDVVKNMIWLADINDFAKMNSVYVQHFTENLPARSVVEAKLVFDLKVEMESILYKPL